VEKSRAFSVTVSAVIVASALGIWVLGFLILPVIDARNSGIDSFAAICRALGIGGPIKDAATIPQAAPASMTAWNNTTLDIVSGGDPVTGAMLAQDSCVACHNPNGLSADPATMPSTTGQSARAIYKQLMDMKRGDRPNDTMKPLLDDLNEKQLADLAAYYSGLPRRNHDIRALENVSKNVIALVTKGDVARALPACGACHGAYTGGPLETPGLTGQYPDYVVAQLKAYASGARKNDLYGRMRGIAGKLTDEEIRGLAAYYDAPR